MGYGRTTRNVRGGIGEGHTESYRAGIYLTPATPAGWYADAIAKYSNFTNNYTVRTDAAAQPVTAQYAVDAWAGSLELGKHTRLGKNWYVQPSLQAAYATLSRGAYSTNTNIRVNITAANLVQARAGFNWVLSKMTQVYFDYEYAAAKAYSQPYAFNLGIHFAW